MNKIHRKIGLSGVLLLGLPFVYAPSVFAAKPINLGQHPVSVLQSFISSTPMTANAGGQVTVSEIRRSTDMKNTLHVRVQQHYAGYPVWGADAVIHVPAGAKTMKGVAGAAAAAKSVDGTFYQDLNVDLGGVPAQLFGQAQSQKAMQQAVTHFQDKAGSKAQVKDQQSQMMVFVDKAGKAHWAYKVSFYVEPSRAGMMPAKPVYIMDAVTSQIYEQWDNIKTLDEEIMAVRKGGGFGGNKKMGELVYDGQEGDLAVLEVQRNKKRGTCSLQNTNVTVKGYKDKQVSSFSCPKVDNKHGGVFFDAELHAVNGGYSPDNDALFGGQVIKGMYSDWYHVPVLTNSDGSPMMLNMVVHDPIDNAYWDGQQMTFGDGVTTFYPLTSLGVAAHEISHGFTEQHSDLAYYGESGSMNEAFSDMAAQAAEVYAYGKNSWQIGPEIFKTENEALRYMDKPSRDCKSKKPGSWCSIDDASQYYNGLDVHYGSGVYNRFFYLLGTTEGWDARKAFDVMVQANSNYWTSRVNFVDGACGVLRAAKDLDYNVDDVKTAFAGVKIDTSNR